MTFIGPELTRSSSLCKMQYVDLFIEILIAFSAAVKSKVLRNKRT